MKLCYIQLVPSGGIKFTHLCRALHLMKQGFHKNSNQDYRLGWILELFAA